LLVDKAYSHPSTRTELRSRRIKHTIPQRSDQIARRTAKGSTGGRPPAFDAALYRLRNTVERGFNRLKQWRGVATRYDKYALTYLGGVLVRVQSFTRAWAPPNWETRPSKRVRPERPIGCS
jgi:putative transposase